MAIGALRRVDECVRAYSGQIRLSGMPAAVREVLKITKLDGGVFQIFDSCRSARESFDSRRSKTTKRVKISRHGFSGTGPPDGTTVQDREDYVAPSPGEDHAQRDVEFRRVGIREEKEVD